MDTWLCNLQVAGISLIDLSAPEPWQPLIQLDGLGLCSGHVCCAQRVPGQDVRAEISAKTLEKMMYEKRLCGYHAKKTIAAVMETTCAAP